MVKDLLMITLVDNKGKKLGYMEKFKCHKFPLPLHSAISVLIFDKDKILLQKRSKYKKTWPLVWANTCCSHPYKGESFLSAAKRRLKEEMGIESSLKELFRFTYKAIYDKTWGENEYDVVFTGNYKGEVKPDKKEVCEYKWVSLRDLKKDISKNPKLYTPWLKLILERI